MSIQSKRGQSVNIADVVLAEGEIAVCLDSGKVYFGVDGTKTKTCVNPDGGTASTASKLATARALNITGDATGTTTFDGSADETIILTFSNSGVSAGTYKSVTVDAKGRVTGGTNPTTLSGYGITDGAGLDSPNFSGVPKTPTATAGTNTTQIATTAFVATAIANLVSSAPTTLDTLKELATALGNDPNYATTITNALGLKAPLASPTFSGIPTAPTATLGTNTTQIATTAFVTNACNNMDGGTF